MTNEVAVVEVRADATHIMRLHSIGQATIVEDCWTCQSLVAPNGPKPNQTVRRIRERLGRDMEITLVINSPSVVCLVQKAPVSTEQAIRSHLHQIVLQQHKIDLAKSFWSVLPMTCGFDDQRGLTEALSNKLNVIVCSAPRQMVETLQGLFLREGCAVRQTLFPVHCLTKAFEEFGGTAFETQTIALLHCHEDRYSLAFCKRGTLISYVEKGRGADTEIAREVRDHIASLQAKYKTQVRCIFVSSDGRNDQQLADEFKAVGSYARTWNACRKLSFGSVGKAQEQFVESSHFNVLAGGVAAGIEAARTPTAENELEEEDIASGPSQLRILTRPFAVVLCLLLLPLGYFLFENAELQKGAITAGRHYTREQKEFDMRNNTAGDVHQRMADLELFARSRHRWPQIITELRSISVPGVELLQLKANDTLSGVEANPFQPISNTTLGKNHGSLVLEARNDAGLVALETFMDSVKSGSQLRSLLHKKRPARLLNNFVLTTNPEQEHQTTLFSVEYVFDERYF